jgi:thymidylate synthase (FAD)
MQVSLLHSPPSPERAVAVAARICYAPISAAELMGEMGADEQRRVLETVMKSGHFSALEHASYTFAVDGVSRALTHQLVRHRLASYNQQSQRYVAMGGDPEVVTPRTVEADEQAQALFAKSVEASFAAYEALMELGIPTEDARYVLPNACASRIVVTRNIRELLHFFELRCCKRAQWEIQELAGRMLALVESTAPYIFMDAGAGCRRGPCPEGKLTCGAPFARIRRD